MTGARQPPTPDHPAGDDDVPAPGNSGQRPVEESSRRLVAGRYRLDTMIGRGSTGTVWAATDQLLRRRVALKKINLPRGMPAEAAQLQQRTLREARAAAALSSPHVITVFDILPATPTGPVIVMELLDGQSLAQLIQQRGRLPPGQAATIGVAVASALLAAHATGITHRDVKPGNVLITGDGFVKLTDFGIARDAAEHTITGARVILGVTGLPRPGDRQRRPRRPGLGRLEPGRHPVRLRRGPPTVRQGHPDRHRRFRGQRPRSTSSTRRRTRSRHLRPAGEITEPADDDHPGPHPPARGCRRPVRHPDRTATRSSHRSPSSHSPGPGHRTHPRRTT